VQLLLEHQVTHPLLANLLKGLYVDVAEREFALEGKAQTDSRLSLLTGIHRKEVKRLRAGRAPGYAPPSSVSLGARLVAHWTGSPAFLDAEGRPRPLPRSSADEPSFEQLVASQSTDIRARAVLDEWQRLGVVQIDEEGWVHLVVDAFVPARGFDEKAHYFGRNLHDHIASGAHNLAGAGAPMLERSVYYDGLSPASVDELAELAERQGMEALQVVNRRAMELQARDASSPDASLRMNFGAYFHRAAMAETPDEEPEDV
jgi:hypothetical protein